MSDSDDDVVTEWSMLDDRLWRLRPGFRLPHPMSYDEMCQYVNVEARKVGADPFRPKRRRMTQVEGGSVPRSVTFYCNHSRLHKDQVGKKELKRPDADRKSRNLEARRLLYSECPCSFVVVPDPSVFLGALVEEDAQDEVDAEEEEKCEEGGPKTSTLSQNLKMKWLVPDAPPLPGDRLRRGRVCKAIWTHTGHPKRCVNCGDITKEMHPDIFSASRTNTPMSTLQAQLLHKFDVFISMSQLRYAIDTLNLGVVEGRITSMRNPSAGNQAQNLIAWILEQDDTDCCLLVEDVDQSSKTEICFQTWLRKKEEDKFTLIPTEFDGGDVLRPKQVNAAKDEEIHNDRVYDSNRFITLKGIRVFLIGIAWTHDYEVRIFSAYPDLLVFDGKMNTNKQRQEYFCGVGVDGAWRNSVLFRAWLPNKTDDACQWFWLHAVPLLIEESIRLSIFGVMADDCTTMGPILKRFVCTRSGILKNAHSYLCIYHFERNFFSKFGIGSSVRQYNMTASTPTKYRGGNWGAKVDWAYPWQQALVGALYKAQQSESRHQFNEVCKWITSIINTAPNMGPQNGKLRNAVRSFFEMKYQTQVQWVKFHRLRVRIMDANASSRGEGEFSHTEQLGLTSGMTYRSSIIKLKFGSERRKIRKIVNAETLVGTRQKRRGAPLYDATLDEWQFLMDKFTPHYSKAIEKQIAAAAAFLKAQLVEHSQGDRAVWKVWSKKFTGDDASSSDSDSCSASSDEDDDSIRPPSQWNFTDEAGQFDHFPPPDNAGRLDVDADDVQIDTFQWRYVREVTTKLVDGKYEFTCSCGKLERTCIVCRHIFCVFWLVFRGWCVHMFKWHRITLKKFYYTAVVSDKVIDCEVGRHHCHPTFGPAAIEAWLASNVASTEGVPTEGRIMQTDDRGGGHFDANDEAPDGASELDDAGPTTKRLRANPASCDAKMMAILSHLGSATTNAAGHKSLNSALCTFISERLHGSAIHEIIKSFLGAVSNNQSGYNTYHRLLDGHLTVLTSRAPLNAAGHPITKRLKASYERGNRSNQPASVVAPVPSVVAPVPSRHAPARAPIAAAATPDAGADKLPFFWNINFQGKTNAAARAFVSRWGGHQQWIVEVFADDKHAGYVDGDRWFMKIINGLVQGPEGDQYITACRWLIKNSVDRVDKAYPNNETCEIRQIKAYGPPNCPLFQGLLRDK